jgi:alkylmercury lyase
MRQRISVTIDHLAARWAKADKRLLRQVFPLLAEGRPVPVERIVERTGASAATVEEALAYGRAGRDAAGRVVELSGLMLSATLHRVEVGGVALFSCCALLAHLTPLLLACSVRVEAVDPQSRGVIRIDLNPSNVGAITPASAVGTFVSTDSGELAADLRANFCSHVHHFVDRASAEVYAIADARRYVVEIRELRSAAEQLYRAAWS